jgi:hypothetical protein
MATEHKVLLTRFGKILLSAVNWDLLEEVTD